jgi:hypothetical protein
MIIASTARIGRFFTNLGAGRPNRRPADPATGRCGGCQDQQKYGERSTTAETPKSLDDPMRVVGS